MINIYNYFVELVYSIARFYKEKVYIHLIGRNTFLSTARG